MSFSSVFNSNHFSGTLKERGISFEKPREDIGEADVVNSDDKNDGDEKEESEFEEGLEVYHLPWLPNCIQRSSLSKVAKSAMYLVRC